MYFFHIGCRTSKKSSSFEFGAKFAVVLKSHSVKVAVPIIPCRTLAHLKLCRSLYYSILGSSFHWGTKQFLWHWSVSIVRLTKAMRPTLYSPPSKLIYAWFRSRTCILMFSIISSRRIAIYYVALVTLIFARVKIWSFRAKAHLVLYFIGVYISNRQISFLFDQPFFASVFH